MKESERKKAKRQMLEALRVSKKEDSNVKPLITAVNNAKDALRQAKDYLDSELEKSLPTNLKDIG